MILDEVFIQEIEGDLLTPIAIYQRLSGSKKFLLESSLKHEEAGRYSFIGSNPTFELKAFGEQNEITYRDGKHEILNGKPLEIVKKLLPDRVINTKIPFIGGGIGYVAYDVIRSYEKIGPELNDELQLPDVHLLFYEDLVVFDHLLQKVFLIYTPFQGAKQEEDIQQKLKKRKEEIEVNVTQKQTLSFDLKEFQPSITKDEFTAKVVKAKQYIEDGDIFQVVLSQRLTAEALGDPFSFYRKLRVQNPSPYMYYLDFEEYQLIGASPESLVSVRDRVVRTNPIAGTRPRGKSEIEDEQLSSELRKDEKELAEHRMLVDLGRNDLGRVCEFGSIQLEKYMEIEAYKHVMHLVSQVKGMLKPSVHEIDALISCLPAGTVSGAPKIRAMEIINEFENVKRSFYSGAIGYFSLNGNMDFALAIRTMLVKENRAHIQAGAGIVYDSIPEKEYEETLHKLKAFLEGLT